MKSQSVKTNRVLLLGGGAREHVIGAAIARSRDTDLYTISHNFNPGLERLSRQFVIWDEGDVEWVANWAQANAITLAVVGLEDPLALGVSDALWAVGVPTVGPKHAPAQLEASKLYTRELMLRHRIAGSVAFHYFSDPDVLSAFLAASEEQWALKPVGLTAGQGVKLMGEHLQTIDEAIAYGRRVIAERIGGTAGIVLEELLTGPEFTLQCFVDGTAVLPMPLVRDYKRAFDGDRGPNTGSMGSYSLASGLLPFVDGARRDEALSILRHINRALVEEGHLYQGIMYGQFIMTPRGLRLIEINARFGDPEAINVLPLLENDFVEVCQAITTRSLSTVSLRFKPKATVCKYLTPPGYGVEPQIGVPIMVDEEAVSGLGVELFFAKVEKQDANLVTTRSRTVALLGIGETPQEAEAAVEDAAPHVRGQTQLHMRHDIGRVLDAPVDIAAELAGLGRSS